MFKVYNEKSKLTLVEQKALNKVTCTFLGFTSFYWLGVGTRLILFWMELNGKINL